MPSDSPDGNVRPRWRGYAQLLLIAVLVIVALRLARAPARVEVDVGSGATVESGTPTVSTFDPVVTEESMTVDLTGTVSLADRVSVMAEVGGARDLGVSGVHQRGKTRGGRALRED